MLDERIQRYEKNGEKGKYILYRMQASVRYTHNLALIYDIVFTFDESQISIHRFANGTRVFYSLLVNYLSHVGD